MAPRRLSKRNRQIRTIVFHSPPNPPNSSTRSPSDSKTTPTMRSPESLRFEGPEPLCIKELSPKIVPRLPKLKLNLDIPEEDPEDDVNYSKDHLNILERTISIDKVCDEISYSQDPGTSCYFTSPDVQKMAAVEPRNEPTNELARKNERNEEMLDNITICRLPTDNSDLPRFFDAPEASRNGLEKLMMNRLEEAKEIETNQDLLISSLTYQLSSASSDHSSKYSKREARTPQLENILTPRDDGNEENLSNDLQQMASVCQTDEFSSKSSIKSIDSGVRAPDKMLESTFTAIPAPKRCRTTLKFDEVKIKSEERRETWGRDLKCGVRELAEIEECRENTKISWGSSPESRRSGIAPKVTESGCKTICVTMEGTDSQVDVENQSRTDSNIIESRMFRVRISKCWGPLNNFLTAIEWIGKKILACLKRGYKIILRGDFYSERSKKSGEGDLGKVFDGVRKENERMVMEISERINCLSKELLQTAVTNQESLSALTKEVETLKITNVQLLSSNDTLRTEMKTLSECLDTFKSKSTISAVVGPPIPPPPPPPPPMSGLIGPPPPPPPPPPPMPSLHLTTPRTPFTLTKKSPTRKCSTPLESRPSITVEDLLKVTLKKAPQPQKDPGRTPLTAKHGPVVSLDMLRSVKLKSARRRSADSARSPRRVHPYKSRSTQCLSLSPIAAREHSPLHRILRQVNGPRRGFRSTMNPIYSSQNDLDISREDREIDARCNRSHSVIT